MYAESQIGWIPYALAARRPGLGGQPGLGADQAHPRAAVDLLLPATCPAAVINDPHGLASLDEVGVDNVTCETDYPHSDSSWPDTKAIMTELLAGLDDATVRKITRDNAIRLLQLDLS